MTGGTSSRPGVQERIFLHLSDYVDLTDKVEVPFALSQMGIANAVSIARSNVPRAISGMKEAGHLVERQAHDFAQLFLAQGLLLVDFVPEDDKGYSLQFRHLEEILELSLRLF